MRKCPQCGQMRSRFSHRNLFEKALGFILLVRPYRCNICMRRFWWFAWKQRDVKRHRNVLILVGLAVVVLVGSYLYLKTLPYESELPREPGVRPAAVATHMGTATTDDAAVSDSPPQDDIEVSFRPGAVGKATDPPDDPAVDEAVIPTLPVAPPFEAGTLRDRGRLLDILSVVAEERLLMLLKTDAPPRTFEYFLLPAPDRLVIDIQGRWGTDLPSELPLVHPLADGLRVGRHEDMVRVVVQLAQDIAPPEIEVRSDGLALTLEPPR